ncbi:hypothetical protein [Limobrevibacterium gyesilva]|uniref:Uncharacterized protein n=1 Tax=Limobrevibacterium gyesilva TaxID=2991712 RepID=A0AA41YSC9_9PROT|nr:hypothetical protein [Limobrevibacterium gyesilva]MCW3477448.1 hypothetical protein [Limobrevibacterium gyesilva]
MPPTGLGDTLPVLRDVLQIASSIAVILVAIMAWLALRGTRTGNRVQLDIDLQVLDVGGSGELVGELQIALQNLGMRQQKLSNLFIEVRPSRHVSTAGGAMVPVTNVVTEEDYPLMLAPGVRQLLTWTFEIPRDERLLRATAVINTGKWLGANTVTTLSQKHFWNFGPTVRYASRVFDVSPSPFRRF